MFASALSSLTGIFMHALSSELANISQHLYAHRHHPNLMVMEVEVVRQVASKDPITVNLVSSFTPQSVDIDFQPGPDYRGGRRVHLVWHLISPM